MRSLRVWVWFLGAATTMASPPARAASPARPPPGVPQLTAADLAGFLDPLIDKELARHETAGGVVVVVKDGRVVLGRGFGYADVENGRPMTPDATLIRPGSISKLFTGIAVMQLVEQGRLDLDRDVNESLDFRVPTPPGGVPVTLRRLLTHRAGFEEHVKGVFSAARTPDALGPWLARSLPPRLYPGGDVPAYSNYGVALAGHVVERAAGVPYADYVRDHILRPLGMDHSTFQQPLPDALAPLLARSYPRADGPPLPFAETIQVAPAGALTASGADMGRFMLALLAGGSLDGARILQAATLDRMMAPQVTTATGSMGLVFFDTQIDGHRFIGHDGATQTFFSKLLLSPGDAFGLFLSVDGSGGARVNRELPRAIIHRYFPPVVNPAPKPAARPADGGDAGFAGVYQISRRADSTLLRLNALANQILVRRHRDGTVTLHGPLWPFGHGTPLRPLAPRMFRDPKERELAFEEGMGEGWRLNIGAPAQQWLPVPWYLDGRLVVPALAASVLVALLDLLLWPVAAVRRRFRRWRGRPGDAAPMPRARLLVRLVLALQLGVVAATVVLFAAGSSNYTLLGDALDPALIALYSGAWLGVLGGLSTVFVTWRSWRQRVGGRWTRVVHGLLAASALTLAWFFVTWRIAGTTLNY